MTFRERLAVAWERSQSLLCVGLDPLPAKFPAAIQQADRPILEFNRAIIDATAPYACSYKPQFAHYAAADALDDLRDTIAYIAERYPDKVVILDSKRGDIGSTAERYALEAFKVYGADAVTVNPYLGGDSLEPFLAYQDRGVIVLCKTSNPGSGDFQNLDIGDGKKLYERVAELAAQEWNGHDNVGLVVGATYPGELASVREIAPTLPLLVPGIGAQGGDLEAVLKAGSTPEGGLLINSSRGILYASNGSDFADAAAQEARNLFEQIRTIRSSR
ncbi:MAG: orotidine-5'-phosphate decarboxylase [Verrucomicrobiota bacterium JB022]|nr:orotidine-5'-phosphate decarboxylase [Verrucomicrobiota bacterium JB022]